MMAEGRGHDPQRLRVDSLSKRSPAPAGLTFRGGRLRSRSPRGYAPTHFQCAPVTRLVNLPWRIGEVSIPNACASKCFQNTARSRPGYPSLAAGGGLDPHANESTERLAVASSHLTGSPAEA